MLTQVQRQHIRFVTRNLQIIVGALSTGVVIFLGIVLTIAERNPPGAQQETTILTYIGVAFAAAGVIVWAIVPNLLAAKMRQSALHGTPPQFVANLPNAAELGDVAALTGIYQTRTIIATALLEGLAFFNLVSFQLEAQTISLIVAVILLLMLISHFPTVSRVEDWVERQRTDMEQFRQLNR